MVPGVVVQAVSAGTQGTSVPSSTSLDASLALSGTGDARSHGGGADTASGGNAGSGAGPGGGGAGGTGAAALQQLGATQTSSSTTPTPTLRVHADVDSDDFPQAVADRVSFAVGNGWSGVKLSVNPPQLGPIELSITIQGEHAQVAMSTHSAVTREALDSSAPKLKEMLNAQGFTQVSVDISQRSFQDRSSTPQQYAWTPSTSSASAAPAAVAGGSSAATRTAQGLLDAYA
jgi:flagellar hook-length control protein FliK